MKPEVNAYVIFDESEPATILYHSLASSVDEVIELARDASIDIEGLTIEIERTNVRDQLRRPYDPHIKSALA